MQIGGFTGIQCPVVVPSGIIDDQVKIYIVQADFINFPYYVISNKVMFTCLESLHLSKIRANSFILS